jgi:two-component system NarL family sensor kinase
MQKTPYDIAIFLIITTAIILLMIGFIISIIYLYRKKQIAWLKNLEVLNSNFEKNILASRLEIQEETFLNISREIHDNISLSLTLAKLHMNTLDLNNREIAESQIQKSIELLSASISELSEISKRLNAELITEQGLLKALENETKRIEEAGLFKLKYQVEGNPVYLEAQRELIIFRIIQEAFNNIIKHSGTKSAELKLNYNATKLYLDIIDYGNGFKPLTSTDGNHAGLKNMNSRTAVLNGTMNITSIPGQGTALSFIIPYQ